MKGRVSPSTRGMAGPKFSVRIAMLLAFALGQAASASCALASQAAAPASTQDAAVVRTVGTVKVIADKSVTLTTDAHSEMTVLIQEGTKIVRVAPGQTDIKQATPIALSDLQVGDRILVRGKTDADGKSVDAASLIAMAKTDVAAKQAQDREAWQRHGMGGIVSAVDAANSTITISTTVIGEKKSVVVQVGKTTVLRRYAPDSVKFDDAKVSTFDKVQVGDQLRARGTRSADGSGLAADEVVCGTFRNIAGTVSALDAAAGTMVVQDLATKKAVTVKVTADTQLRKLPPPVAQRIAARLKGESPDAASGDGQAGGAAAPSANGTNGAAGAPAGANASGPASGQGAGSSGAGRGQGGDLQQLIGRMPAASLSDLQKGDAVMIVSTEGAEGGAVTAITLLAGVEPILQSSGGQSILSPWSLGGAPGGDTGTP
jgi:co-chaperonin GroES (HSP10)